MAKTKKQLATEKIVKPRTKNLKYKFLKQKKNVVTIMQNFRAPINPQVIDNAVSQKIVKNAHKNMGYILAENF